MPRINQQRNKARVEGRKLYIDTRPHKCGCVVRYTNNSKCHYCANWGEYKKREQTSERKEYHWETNIKKKYGIDSVSYYKLLEEQNGVCAICFSTCVLNEKLSVDHCHDTGKVRGLLCNNCNTGLGKFKDNIKLLESSVLYLKEATTNNEF